MTNREIFVAQLSLTELGLPGCVLDECNNPRVDPTDRCWDHLSADERERVRAYVSSHRDELSGAQLAGADLSGLDLRGAHLDRALLHGVKLDGSNLSEARLRKAQLIGASATRASFRGAKCNWLTLSNSDLREANLERAVLAACHAHEADFSGANLQGVLAPNADFTSASFEGANLSHAHLEGSTFKFARASAADLRNANLQFTQFSRADLRNADISRARVYGMSPWDCSTDGIIARDLQQALDAHHPGLLPSFLAHPETIEGHHALRIRCATTRLDLVLPLLQAVNGVYAHSSTWGTQAATPLQLTRARQGSLDLYFVVDILDRTAETHLALFSVAMFLSGSVSALALRRLVASASRTLRRMTPRASGDTPGLGEILASLVHHPEDARMLAVRAGFPREHLPDFKTPLWFWSTVVDQTTRGMSDLDTLVDEAIRLYPHNVELRAYAAADEMPLPSTNVKDDRVEPGPSTPPERRSDETVATLAREPSGPTEDRATTLAAPTVEQRLAMLEHGAELLRRLRDRGFPVGKEDERRVVERVLAVVDEPLPSLDPRLAPLTCEVVLGKPSDEEHALLRTSERESIELVFVRRATELSSARSP